MTPSEILLFVQSQMKDVTDEDSAIKYFENQRDAVGAIKDTRGMKEIRDYRYRVYDSACVSISQIDAKDVSKMALYQAQITSARSFLEFLDNVTS